MPVYARQFLIALLAALYLTVAPVIAGMAAAQQMGCGPTAQIMAGLEARFGERPVVIGAMQTGSRMTLTANDDTGTWSILLLSPDGQTACMAANGDGLQAAPKPETKPGNPS